MYLLATLSTSAGFWHRPVTSPGSEHALLCSIVILWSCCVGAASSMNHVRTLYDPAFIKRSETHPEFFYAQINIQLELTTTRNTYTDPYPGIVGSITIHFPQMERNFAIDFQPYTNRVRDQ